MNSLGRVLPHGQNSSEVNEKAIGLYMWLLRYYAEHGYAPSIREMMVATGISSTSVVDYHIDVLIEWGWIRRGYIDKETGQLVRGVRDIKPARATERGLSAAEIGRLYGWQTVALSEDDVKPNASKQRRASKHWKPVREQIKPFGG